MSSRLGELLELYCERQERLSDAEVEFGLQISLEDAGRVLKPRWPTVRPKDGPPRPSSMWWMRLSRAGLAVTPFFRPVPGRGWTGVASARRTPMSRWRNARSEAFSMPAPARSCWNLLCERMAGEARG